MEFRRPGAQQGEFEERERQTPVALAKAIVARGKGLREADILDIESRLIREGLDPQQLENAFIEMAKAVDRPPAK